MKIIWKIKCLTTVNKPWSLCLLLYTVGYIITWSWSTGMHCMPRYVPMVNTLRPRQKGRHFADDTFKRIFLKENVRISIIISLKFVPKSPIDNIPALFQIMVLRRPGNKPLSEAMMVSLLMDICVARFQWVNHNMILDTVLQWLM